MAELTISADEIAAALRTHVGSFEPRLAKEQVGQVLEVGDGSALPLDDGQLERLAAALGRATGKTVEVKVVVDPSVMGGLVARVGDTVIDGTVRHRLNQLKEQL